MLRVRPIVERYVPIHLPTLLSVIGLAILFSAAVYAPIPGLNSLEHSIAQFIIFPFICILFWLHRAGWYVIPRSILVLAALGASFGAFVAYGPPLNRAETFYVARLPQDRFEIGSRLLREGIYDGIILFGLRRSDVRAVRYADVIHSWDEARALVRSEPLKRPLVWSDRKSINVIMPEGFTGQGEASPLPYERLIKDYYGLEFVGSVRTITFSFEPLEGAKRFLGALFSGFLEAEGAVQSEELLEEKRIRVTQAGAMEFPWARQSHRAYPFWLLGNYHVQSALSGRYVEMKHLLCALKAYSRAKRYLGQEKNSELMAALLNNQAVVARLIAIQKKSKKQAKSARKLLQRAVTIRGKNPLGEPHLGVGAANRNLSLLGKERAERKLAKARKPRHR